MSTARERLLYPDVLATTRDVEGGPYFAEAVTNNHDTVVRMAIYWYIPPEDADDHEPVLMIEIDDEFTSGPDPMDVRIRVRRNDGLIYEGNQAEQKNIKEEA